MNNEFLPSSDPAEIQQYLHNLGLVPLNQYYSQLKQILKRQKQSAKLTNEQIQKKLAENGIYKDDSSKDLPLLYPRKRTSFSPVITRKRGKAIKKRTPSTTQESSTQEITNPMDDDQPLDLRVQTKS